MLIVFLSTILSISELDHNLNGIAPKMICVCVFCDNIKETKLEDNKGSFSHF